MRTAKNNGKTVSQDISGPGGAGSACSCSAIVPGTSPCPLVRALSMWRYNVKEKASINVKYLECRQRTWPMAWSRLGRTDAQTVEHST